MLVPGGCRDYSPYTLVLCRSIGFNRSVLDVILVQAPTLTIVRRISANATGFSFSKSIGLILYVIRAETEIERGEV